MVLLKGKQIEGIQQRNMLVNTDTITENNNVTNKEYADNKINEQLGKISMSGSNLNMTANVTSIGTKVCEFAVIDTPISNIMVKVNGVLINIGEGLDAYFSPDSITIRNMGYGQKGDFLYWNITDYDLDNDDEIDFIYLMSETGVVPDILFNIGSGFNGVVSTMIQDNDTYIVGGYSFSTYQGETANRIIRLYKDGSIDTTFNSGTGFNSPVERIIQDGDKYVIVGQFTTYNDQTTNRIIRLNHDGSVDTTFILGSGFNADVNTIIQDGDKYVIGGYFSSYNGLGGTRLIRLNQDGSIDTTVNLFSNNSISSIIQDISKYIIVGNFTSIVLGSYNRIVRLNKNGTIDTTFNIGSGFNLMPRVIIQDGDKYVVGGYFTSYNGQTANRIIRLNQNGTIDTTFNSGSGFNQYITSIIKDDDKYVIGGFFTTYNGQPAGQIIRLNQDGSMDNTFSIFMNNTINIIIKDGDKYVVGGQFTSNGNYIIRLNQDGSSNTLTN